MKYDIYGDILAVRWAIVLGLIDDVPLAISTGYICSCIGGISLSILTSNLHGKLKVEEKKISAKEEDYLYTLQNIQHRIWRLHTAFLNIINH